MQHGEALAESEDPARRLSALGHGEVERVARHAARLGLGIAFVGHSGKLRALARAEEASLLVGHLPHLARLTSLLIARNAARSVVAFRMGALVALTRDDEGSRVRSVLPPELTAE